MDEDNRTVGLLSSKISSGEAMGLWISSLRLIRRSISAVNSYMAFSSACVQDVAINCCFVDLE